MNVAAHEEKIRRLEALRQRLDPLEDFELWFWTAMNAGTHAVNAALHHAGITGADDRGGAMALTAAIEMEGLRGAVH